MDRLYPVLNRLDLEITDISDEKIAPFDGLYVPEARTIFIADHIFGDPGQMVFITSHELGHIFHEHKGDHISQLLDYRSAVQVSAIKEQEADFFAAALLIPGTFAGLIRRLVGLRPHIADSMLSDLLKVAPQLPYVQRFVEPAYELNFVQRKYVELMGKPFNAIPEDICRRCPLFPILKTRDSAGIQTCVLSDFCPRRIESTSGAS